MTDNISTPVAVLPDRTIPAFTGENTDVSTFAIVDLQDALFAAHNNFAHFTTGVCYIDGQRVSDQPRFSVSGRYPENWTWRFHAVAVDVDAPGKQRTAEWWESQLACLAKLGDVFETAYWYQTRGGYRLVWRTREPLALAAYLDTLRRLYSLLKTVGVRPDEFYDWTRLYMLPNVIRDGKRQVLPRSDTLLGVLPELPEPAVDDTTSAGALQRLQQVALSPFNVGAWAPGERNSRMFKAVAELWRNVDGMDADTLLGMAHTLNQTKCADDPMGDDEIERIVRNVMTYKQPQTNAPVSKPTPTRTKVFVFKGQLPSAVDAVMQVVQSTPGIYYKQSGKLVRLVQSGEGHMSIEELPRSALREILERHCAFVTTRNTKDEIIEVPIDLPKELLDVIACRTDDHRIRELQEVLATPTITPTGSVLSAPGYCEEMQLFYAPTGDVSNLIIGQTRQEAEQAITMLRDVFCDFPFASEEHRSCALAALLTPLVRSAITGPTPLFIFDSTTPGSGKSLLADVAALTATGQTAPRMALTHEEEFEKRVTALLSGGARTVLIDNVDRPLGGATLDALLTSDQWQGRVLGHTRMVKLRARAVWMATGNNVQIQGDLARRALRVYLDPNMERPEERGGFKHGDMLSYVRANRAKLVAAGLTIVRAYLNAGVPDVGLSALGSFEQWSRLVRAPLVWLGEVDPLLSQTPLRTDGTVTSWGTFLTVANVIWAQGSFTAKDIHAAVAQSARRPGVSNEVYTAFEAVVEEMLGDRLTVRNISLMMRRWTNRIIDGKALRRREGRDRVRGNIYYVEAPENVAELVQNGAARGATASRNTTNQGMFGSKADYLG